ncbi:MAG: DedA family protein [Magnetococcales bacterium]|nr:DedA family protein [Magnetococcales bacterium]
MTLSQLLSEYGYWAVLIGSLLEGETILVLAGLAAFQGYLSYPLIVVIAFVGGTAGDQFYFHLGRHYGTPLLGRFPALAARAGPVNRLIVRYNTALIVGVRFMYGIRIAGPIIIGMSDVDARRFLLLNVLGAAIWAVIVPGFGYLFGPTLNWLLADIPRYEEAAFVVLIGVVALVGVGRWWSNRRKR